MLECLATWKDGLVKYLYARLTGAFGDDDDDAFRCFVCVTLCRVIYCVLKYYIYLALFVIQC